MYTIYMVRNGERTATHNIVGKVGPYSDDSPRHFQCVYAESLPWKNAYVEVLTLNPLPDDGRTRVMNIETKEISVLHDPPRVPSWSGLQQHGWRPITLPVEIQKLMSELSEMRRVDPARFTVAEGVA
jgi:hypothetical protein